MISSVGDSVQKPIVGVQDDTCHSCGEIGHRAHQCPSKNQQQQRPPVGKGDKGDQGEKGRTSKRGLKCDLCGITNSHTESTCRKKAAAMANIQSANAPAFNVTQADTDPPPPHYDPRLLTPGMMEQARFVPALQQLAVQQPAATAASLATYLSQLQQGRAPTTRHVSVKSHSTQNFNSGSSMALWPTALLQAVDQALAMDSVHTLFTLISAHTVMLIWIRISRNYVTQSELDHATTQLL